MAAMVESTLANASQLSMVVMDGSLDGFVMEDATTIYVLSACKCAYTLDH